MVNAFARCARLPMIAAGSAALLLLMLTPRETHARQVGANGPVALPPAAPLSVPSPTNSSPSAPGAAAENVGGDSDLHGSLAPTSLSPAAPEVGHARQAPLPASEARPLGRPNSTLSARPVEHETSGEESAGALGTPGSSGMEFTRVLGALAAVVGLILLARIVMVRYFPNLLRLGGAPGNDRPSGVIEVLARYPLPGAGRGQQLIVLKFARRVLLAHQAGSNVRTLSEMTDPNEVAALLARLEAGANEKSQQKFRATLERFESEHEVALAAQSRAGAAIAATQTEIIDLTRAPSRGAGGVVRARRLLR